MLNGESIAHSEADSGLAQAKIQEFEQNEDQELTAEESSVAELLADEDTVVNEPVPPLPSVGEQENHVEKEGEPDENPYPR